MAKAYVSSTFYDLREYREKARNVLQQMGHDDMAMEYYVAEESRPLERSFRDIEACDVFISIIAWRYGFIPSENNPESFSVVELECRHAKRLRKPCLIFLLDERARWPVSLIDRDLQPIENFRKYVVREQLGWSFSTTEDFEHSLINALHSLLDPKAHSDSQRLERPSDRLGLPGPPDDLVTSLKNAECVLYAGAGLSAGAGLPTWSLFISGLLQWAREESFIKGDFADSLKEAIEFGQTDVVADSLINTIGANSTVLNDYLKTVFLPTAPTLPSRYGLLKSIPFSAVLSANFDNLLERNFAEVVQDRIYTPSDQEKLFSAHSKNDFYILKLYGTLERPESVVVAPAQYQAAIAQNLIFSQFMDSLFFSRTLLFVGASLDGIAAYLNGLKFQGTSTPRRHYALVDVTGSAWKVNADLLQRRYGITVLPFTATPGYPEVSTFLQELIDTLAAKEPSSAVSSNVDKAARSGAWISRLKLENIGPFDSQEFEFNRGWNVLFGDNGMGKSSVLKAIAVALCGKDARPYAEQLIKTDRPGATITLHVTSEVNGVKEERKYITELYRLRTGAEVDPIPTRALEVENLLSLGFPPLRAMSDGKSTDTATGSKEGPDPGDLLPLISGTPDNRLDKLKNWILDLDHLIKDSQSPFERRRLEAALEELFHVIQVLTPGVDLRRASIDVARKRVMVETQDGVIPIDYVSQGTSSLMGWIGVLWRRLFDQGEKEGRQSDKHALVLIDEIDAHMHPKWQQSLPVEIRRLFPSIQVIATTHSPLIVPALERGEVFSLTRNPETRKIEVEKIDEDFKGYRADQILTSRLFRLDTSRDKQTYEEMMEYTRLAVEPTLDEPGQKRLNELAAKLKVRIPLPWEREESRQTYELIRDALTQKIEEMDFDIRGKILDQVKAQLLDIDQEEGRLS